MTRRSEIILPAHASEAALWITQPGLLDYNTAVQTMDEWVALIATKRRRETVWLVEHPSMYTAGTSSKPQDLLDPQGLPVFATGRGGQYTYHGPGQRVAYVLLNLAGRGGDVRAFVAALEEWLIETLATFEIKGERREDRVGIWVAHGGLEEKIAAIGIRVRRGITFHGVSININPDLAHFAGIIPCGVQDHGVTSFAALGIKATTAEVDDALRTSFQRVFGPTETE